MRYTSNDFIRLIGAVEETGGEHLDETCHSEEITYEIPGGPDRTELTHGCEKEHVFSIPYDPTETVLVPEPLLEVDPDRSEWTDANGEARVTHRSQREKLSDGSESILFEVVERPGELGAPGNVLDRSSVTVCAVGDNVGMWPRFAHAVQDKRSG